MGDLRLVHPALILSILDAGILIMVQQLKLMMFSLNMDYPCTSSHCPPECFLWTHRADHVRCSYTLWVLFWDPSFMVKSCGVVGGWWPKGTGAGTKIMGGHHPTQARMIPLLSQSIIVPTVERPGSRLLQNSKSLAFANYPPTEKTWMMVYFLWFIVLGVICVNKTIKIIQIRTYS